MTRARHPSIRLVSLAAMLACVGVLVGSGGAAAIVPPKNCGYLTVKGTRYNVKADQISCRSARRYTASYLKTRHRPRGYRCRNYTRSRLKFRCERRGRDRTYTFFAIKR
jgi:hypothetical protein